MQTDTKPTRAAERHGGLLRKKKIELGMWPRPGRLRQKEWEVQGWANLHSETLSQMTNVHACQENTDDYKENRLALK